MEQGKLDEAIEILENIVTDHADFWAAYNNPYNHLPTSIRERLSKQEQYCMRSYKEIMGIYMLFVILPLWPTMKSLRMSCKN